MIGLPLCLIFVAYSTKICSGQNDELRLTANFSDPVLNLACLNSIIEFTCIGTGTSIQFISPPFIPEDNPILFTNSDQRGRRFRIDPAVSELEEINGDSNGNVTFEVKSRVPAPTIGYGSAVCIVQQGLNEERKNLTYRVIELPNPPQNVSYSMTENRLSWFTIEGATSYVVKMDNVEITHSMSTHCDLPFKGGDYTVNVISVNSCGRSPSGTVINITVSENSVPESTVLENTVPVNTVPENTATLAVITDTIPGTSNKVGIIVTAAIAAVIIVFLLVTVIVVSLTLCYKMKKHYVIKDSEDKESLVVLVENIKEPPVSKYRGRSLSSPGSAVVPINIPKDQKKGADLELQTTSLQFKSSTPNERSGKSTGSQTGSSRDTVTFHLKVEAVTDPARKKVKLMINKQSLSQKVQEQQ